MPGSIIEGSSNLVGYEAEWFEKDDFEVVGFSALHRPDTPDFELWINLRDDGRLDRLIEACSQPRLFGCSSAADANASAGMPEGTYRHTVCFEVNPRAGCELLKEEGLFRMRFPASRWVSFNLPKERFFTVRAISFGRQTPMEWSNAWDIVLIRVSRCTWMFLTCPTLVFFNQKIPPTGRKSCISGCRSYNARGSGAAILRY
jgi:hypothetical protein